MDKVYKPHLNALDTHPYIRVPINTPQNNRHGTCCGEDGPDALSLVCETEALPWRKVPKGCLLVSQLLQKLLVLITTIFKHHMHGMRPEPLL